jgi:hypothetical protein
MHNTAHTDHQQLWETLRRLSEANWPGDLVIAGRPALGRTRRINGFYGPPVVLTAWGIKDMPREVSVV